MPSPCLSEADEGVFVGLRRRWSSDSDADWDADVEPTGTPRKYWGTYHERGIAEIFDLLFKSVVTYLDSVAYFTDIINSTRALQNPLSLYVIPICLAV